MNILRCTRDLESASFAELAKLVRAIRTELERRNPIGVNMYTAGLAQAAQDLDEIHNAELSNPTCDYAGDTTKGKGKR